MRVHTKHGHSLVELLLGITVAGTMTATAIPAVSSMAAHAHVNQAAVTVSHDLAVAVSDAARERKPIRIALGTGHQSITITDRTSGTLLATRKQTVPSVILFRHGSQQAAAGRGRTGSAGRLCELGPGANSSSAWLEGVRLRRRSCARAYQRSMR